MIATELADLGSNWASRLQSVLHALGDGTSKDSGITLIMCQDGSRTITVFSMAQLNMASVPREIYLLISLKPLYKEIERTSLDAKSFTNLAGRANIRMCGSLCISSLKVNSCLSIRAYTNKL